MTALTPQDMNLLVILGEMRGDLRGIAEAINKMDARMSHIESDADLQIAKLSARITKLETLAIRLGTLSVIAALVAGAAQPQLLKLVQFIFGG